MTIVNYDNDNGFSFLDGFKNKSTAISDEFKKVADKITHIPIGEQPAKWTAWAESMGYTDENLLSFLNRCDNGKEKIGNIGKAVESVGKTTTVAAKAMSGLKSIGGTILSTLGNMAISFAIGAAINAAVKGIDNYIHKSENLIKAGEEAHQAIQTTYKDFSEVQSSLDSLGKTYTTNADNIISTGDAIGSIAEKYSKLSDGVDKLSNKNKLLSSSDYEAYLDISNQLSQQMPSLVSGYDANGNAILNLSNNASEAAQSLTELYEAEMLAANVKIGDNLDADYEGIQEKIKQSSDNIKDFNSELDRNKKKQNSISIDTKDIMNTDIEFDPDTFGKQTTKVRNEIESVLKKHGVSNPLSIDNDGTAIFNTDGISRSAANEISEVINKYSHDSHDTINSLSSTDADIKKEILKEENNIKSYWKEMSESVGNYLKTSKDFTSLNKDLQNAFLGNLDSINPADISNYDGDVSKFIDNDLIKPLADLKPEAQDKLSDLLSLDASLIDVGEYKSKVSSIIKELFPDNKKLQQQMTKNFGFDDVIKNAEDQLNVLTSKFGESTKSLSLDELQKGYDLIVNDGFTGTFDQFKSEIEKAKQLAATEVNLKANTNFDAITVADGTANAGDDYLKGYQYLKEAKEMFDKGLIGTDDFKTRAAYFSPTGADNPVNFAENYAKAARYLTEDASGVINFLDDLSTKTNDAGQALASFDESTGKWTYNINDLQQASKDMGIGFEFMMDMFGRLEDYGFSNNFVGSIEDGTARIAEKTTELVQAEAELARLQAEGADTTAITQQQEKVNALKNDINETRDAMGQLIARSGAEYAEQVSNAKDAISTLNAERQKILKENTYGEDTQAVADAMEEQIRQWASENHLELDANLNVVNKEQIQEEINAVPIEIKVEAKADDANSLIEGLGHGQSVSIPVEIDGESSEIKAFKNFDGTITYTADIDGVETELEPVKETDGTITYKVKSDYNEDGFRKDVEVAVEYIIGSQEDPETKQALLDYIMAYQEDPEFRQALMNYIMSGQQDPSAKQALLDYIKNSQEIPIDENALVNYQKGSQENPDSPQSGLVNWGLGTVSLPSLVLQGVINWVTGSKEGPGQLAGTAHKDGTVGGLYPIPQLSGRALAMGTLQDTSWLKPSWMTKRNQVALTGEEDQELVVKGNRWWTVGDNGAEFASIPQGSVVFNARQTKELFKNGKINSRARHIGGVAYAGGSGGGYNPVLNGGGYGNGGSNYTPSYSSPPQPTQNQTANSIDKATDSAEEFSEELDYIEIKLDRIEREISNIEIIADSAFETFSTRNKALGEQISATTSEIAIQQAAYERYMQAANSVGLSEDYASKVRDGLIDLETITDKTLKENIDDYQKWYEKALDCRDAVNELKESVRELYQQQFDNVVDEFDNILGVIEHRKNILEGYIDLTEAQGYLTSTKYYDALISHEQNSLKELESERKALIGELNNAMSNGNIQMYSEAWYEMQNDINDVNESILEANQNIVDFKNSIQEIQWDVFDKLQERISGIADESDFLTDLMSSEKLFDDTGNITEFGKATMGLHGVNYNTYMSQADEYRKEMEKIQKDLESDPYNETLIERRKELLELQQESILAAEDEKDAIRDLVEEGIELQLDSLKELIEKYENALDSQKDLYDYQNQIAEKQQEIASLEKQMIAYAGDDSEEGNAKKQEIQNQLDEARKDLEETQFDRAISEQKKLLDELYTEYEEVLNLRLDNIDMLVTDVINNVNAESSAIRDTIISKADSVGYQITDTMATILGEGGSVVGTLIKYGDGFTTIMTNVQIAINDIKNLLKESMGYSDNVAEENINASNQQQAEQTTPSSTPPAPALSPEPQTPQGNGIPDIGDAVTFNHGMYYYSSDGLNPSGNELLGQTVYITHINNASWAKKPYHIARDKEGTRPLGWLSLDQISGYKSGTRSVPKDDYYWTNEEGSEMVLHRKGDGAILRGLGRGDVVFNKHATDNMYAMANDPTDFINGYINATTPNIAPINKVSSTENTVNVEVKIDKVMDYDDFLRQMQNDKKFERMIHAMTFDQVLGKGKMTKYNIRI